jgi:hypothetical protein
MMTMILIMGHECKWGTVWREPVRWRREKEKDSEGEED